MVENAIFASFENNFEINSFETNSLNERKLNFIKIFKIIFRQNFMVIERYYAGLFWYCFWYTSLTKVSTAL